MISCNQVVRLQGTRYGPGTGPTCIVLLLPTHEPGRVPGGHVLSERAQVSAVVITEGVSVTGQLW